MKKNQCRFCGFEIDTNTTEEWIDCPKCNMCYHISELDSKKKHLNILS